MNKEEIKKYIKEQIDKCYVIEHMNFEKVDLSKLLDHITNLQEENEKLKTIIIKALHLLNHVEEYDYRLFIECLENLLNDDDLLNILKGE